MANPQVSVVLLEHPEQQNDPTTTYHAQYLIEGDIFSADQCHFIAGERFIEWNEQLLVFNIFLVTPCL